ncbi:hypothetical protein ARMA_2344 [Ardenticatena maritima]|uniref:Uncharacterized protein n=1 Tax=Ardenticatena maritima TaxID=872965 RepID=A0A0M8KA07_9CHLR|nr:hypothetical protein ARMA_2344 [Ardenticatena maritima]
MLSVADGNVAPQTNMKSISHANKKFSPTHPESVFIIL